MREIHIIGGGLAGCEAAWQVARAGCRAVLHEMRPLRQTPAHKTGDFAELVCSNSLKSEQQNSAPWLLKEELRRLGSLLIGEIAPRVRVPAGHALTVDRDAFAAEITRAIEAEPSIEIRRDEVTTLDSGPGSDRIWIIASGPLTSDAFAEEIARVTGSGRLFFYDSISPIIDAESIDTSIAFRASRYDKSLDGTADYLNCPFDKAQYDAFLDALLAAESVPAHIAEDRPAPDNVRYFEACLPIEEIARRGRDTLRFGPMKPMGLSDPRTGRRPYAVVQLRQEDLRAGSYNLVGFQNHMRFGDQQRVLRMILAWNAPSFFASARCIGILISTPAARANTTDAYAPGRVFRRTDPLMEGYVESIATAGLIAGRQPHWRWETRPACVPARETAMGSLTAYVSGADPTITSHEYHL